MEHSSREYDPTDRILTLCLEPDVTFASAKDRILRIFERAYIRSLIDRHNGNLSAASREADLSRRHLRQLLRKHGMYPPHRS